MTAEISILNKHGVAMAADSAVTLGSGKKIYNSADKLFSLSKHHPVGIMIFGGASFVSIPWEVLIKHYRQKILGKKSFPHLKDYAAHFIEFLRTTPKYGKDVEEEFIDRMHWVAFSHLVNRIQREAKKQVAGNSKISTAQTITIIKSVLASEKVQLGKLPFLDKANAKLVSSLANKRIPKIDELMNEVFQRLPLDTQDRKLLRQIAALSTYKARFSNAKTGIVIAGFGEDDIYPAIESYELDGRFGSFLKIRRIEKKCTNISANNHSAIIAFAQSEMVTTFMNGVHPHFQELLNGLQQKVFSELSNILGGLLKGKVSGQDITQLSDHLNGIWPDIDGQLKQFSREEFINPILNTVAALPKDELSSMAEALVNLTSFRRKVTPDAETVGGPIDVLVISKGDGLVWIKRKLYFDPKLNHHYFSNYYLGCV